MIWTEHPGFGTDCLGKKRPWVSVRVGQSVDVVAPPFFEVLMDLNENLNDRRRKCSRKALPLFHFQSFVAQISGAFGKDLFPSVQYFVPDSLVSFSAQDHFGQLAR